MIKLDSTEFSQLYAQYYQRFVMIAKSYVRDGQAAEDIVTDSFVSLWVRKEQLDESSNLPAYVFTTVRNRCMNYLESKQVHMQVQQSQQDNIHRMVEFEIQSLNVLDPEELFVKEIKEIIQQELQQMKPLTRQVFELHRFAGKTYAEIATELGISQRHVTSEIQSALARLRMKLKDYLPVEILAILLNSL